MHIRDRHIENILLKRAKIFPVLGVLGARQVGKSTYLMEQWTKQRQVTYLTFDKQELVIRAKRSPEQLLLDESNNQTTHLIIDETQKVPAIFDSIKAIVDAKRRVGAFTLSGSVEFSSKSGVRESLAGRMGITRLYPMTLREIYKQKFVAPWIDFDFKPKQAIKPKSVETWLKRGGMPIFCGLSDIDERIGIINSWLEAICYRDLQQIKGADYNSDLAFSLMSAIAFNPRPVMSRFAAEFGTHITVIKKHLAALEALFLLYKFPAFESPRVAPQYRIFDAGVLNAMLGGCENIFSRHASLVTLLINEIYAQYEYAGKLKPKLFYYKTRGGGKIDLVLKTKQALVAIECTTAIDISAYQQRSMKSFLKKYNNAVGYYVAPVQESYQLGDRLYVIPWNSIA